MGGRHTNTNLERISWGQKGYAKVMRKNINLLNDTLLYVDALLDVDLSSLSDRDILQYNSSTQKFENVSYDTIFPSTTSTTSTTSSSSSTSSTASSTTTSSSSTTTTTV